MLVRVFIVVLLSFDFFDDCPSNSKTGHEQRIPADSPLRLIVINLLQHVRTFAAYGLSSPLGELDALQQSVWHQGTR